ncbi:isochorismate synthase [Tessaracoccus bendigoensis DSM 12906]|uniref:isochorismate synthase n=1 Tax=Tessaracoccus bendigoensis DSM 12906 TaxID=1123357 RepID=A0A1M6DW09_9ACTN|nr:isochorismate synthase [Tessaracoccus bendigoensis DSM 12906]
MLAKVILDFGSARMRATTVAIDDPGPLERFLPESGPSTAFIRRGEGFVGLGEAARFETDTLEAADVWWEEISQQIDHDSEMPGEFGVGPLAVGLFTFDPDRSEERSVLTVPQTVIGRRGGRCWMTRLGVSHNDMALPPPRGPVQAPVGSTRIGGSMSEDVWTGIVGEVVSLIRSDEVAKVVLARDLRVRADEPIDLRFLLDRLIENYPMTWAYLVDGMVGATPELLLRRQDGLVTSRVLAGTVWQGSEGHEGRQLAAELARSEKDISEHEFAVTSVAEALAPYCHAMNVPDAPSVLRLPNVMHLATDITGVVGPESGALGLAAALHPSAAVCGTPTHLALDIISELESLDRGRYAGPVGWVGMNGDGEWAIALRGGQVRADSPNDIQLFAGAGIVADSDPQIELAETDAKLVPMLQALGLG